jgi:hypothetical protein
MKVDQAPDMIIDLCSSDDEKEASSSKALKRVKKDIVLADQPKLPVKRVKKDIVLAPRRYISFDEDRPEQPAKRVKKDIDLSLRRSGRNNSEQIFHHGDSGLMETHLQTNRRGRDK